jgi:hypothetical protein
MTPEIRKILEECSKYLGGYMGSNYGKVEELRHKIEQVLGAKDEPHEWTRVLREDAE